MQRVACGVHRAAPGFSRVASALVLALASGIAAVPHRAWAGDDAAAPPIEAFFRKAAIGEAAISPTGRYVALVAANKDDHDQLVIVDTQTLKLSVAAAWKYQDVSGVHWASDKRLVYHLADFCFKNCESDFRSHAGPPGMYAVDRDGKDNRPLIGYEFMAPTEQQDGDDIYAVSTGSEVHSRWSVLVYLKAYVLDTRTEEVARRETRRKPLSMLLGRNGVPRVIVTKEDDRHGAIEYRESAESEWVKLESFDFMTGQGGFDPVDFAADDTLYVVARPPGAQYDGLYTYDLKARRLSAEPLVSAKGFDIAPRPIRVDGKLAGLRYETDAESTIWLDAGWKKVQDRIDALLPGTINRVSIPSHGELPVVLVLAYSDVEPGQVFLYDTKADKLVPLGRARPAIDARRMASRDLVRYKARDGLEIPAWITVPKDGKQGPRPMVVLVHGGPYVRGGHWRWDAQSQFLASRGYVVLEPEFRGSTGFGDRHFKAGWKQWGLAMQNDIADGTRWAIDKGIADPKRICIAGASYGGYATLMGLVNDPELYRCGVEWLGVTDIGLMYESLDWSDWSEAYKTYGMPVLIADQDKDAGQIKATSPIHQAARIKAPLLLAYGGLDERVPIKHGTEFRDAVRKTNKDVEWIEYPDEGHGWYRVKTSIDFWSRVEKFLARNIGETATP